MSAHRCTDVYAHECDHGGGPEPCIAHCVKWLGHDGPHTDAAHATWDSELVEAAETDAPDLTAEVDLLLHQAARLWLQVHPQHVRPSEFGELPGIYVGSDGDTDTFTVAAEGAYGKAWLDALDRAGPSDDQPDPVAPGHVVYRHFTAEGILLYVGYTGRYQRRQQTHRREAPWWPESARVTVEPHDTREDALAAELLAIRTEHPLWNVQGRTAR